MTLGSRLQQFFIGGSPELEDITLAGNIPIVQVLISYNTLNSNFIFFFVN